MPTVVYKAPRRSHSSLAHSACRCSRFGSHTAACMDVYVVEALVAVHVLRVLIVVNSLDYSRCFFFLALLLSSFWTSRGHRCRPFSPAVLVFNFFIPHRVQQSHCLLIFHRVLLTHALALSASQFVHKKKSQRIYTSMRSAGLELTKLTYTKLEDNLIRHRGDRLIGVCPRGHTV